MKYGPLVFIYGSRFGAQDHGVFQRTRLTLEAFSLGTNTRPRHLVAEDDAEAREIAARLGWTFHPVPAWRSRHSFPVRSAIRLLALVAARFSRRARMQLVKLIGGEGPDPAAVARLLAGLPPADVWLTRCDLVHLAAALPPATRVVLDSTDTVWNLMRCYDPRRRLRWLAGRNRIGFLSNIREAELALAGHCARIIAISPEDQDYYRQSACPDVVLEESCVATGDELGAEPPCDVGFLGGSHGGSLAAARNFLDLADRPELGSLHFAIAGAVCAVLGSTAGRVQLRGRVPSAAGFFAACRQVVFWSEGETGTSVKFQEAILSGTTVLANAAAARWSRAVPGRDFILCQTQAELAGHLLKGTQLAPSPLRADCTPQRLHDRFQNLLRLEPTDLAQANSEGEFSTRADRRHPSRDKSGSR